MSPQLRNHNFDMSCPWIPSACCIGFRCAQLVFVWLPRMVAFSLCCVEIPTAVEILEKDAKGSEDDSSCHWFFAPSICFQLKGNSGNSCVREIVRVSAPAG